MAFEVLQCALRRIGRRTAMIFPQDREAFGVGDSYGALGRACSADAGRPAGKAALGQSAIGWRDVSPPLQNAVIAATIANGGAAWSRTCQDHRRI